MSKQLNAKLFSIQTERHALAGLCKFSDIYSDISVFVKLEDFVNDTHKTIYKTVAGIIDKKEILNKITLSAKIKQLGITHFEHDLDIDSYIENIFATPIKDKNSAIANFKTLIDYRIRRSLYNLSQELNELALKNTENPKELISESDKIYSESVKHIIELNFEKGAKDIFRTLQDNVLDIANNPPDESKFPMGPFPSINNLLGSLHRPGNITLYAARTGMGKANSVNTNILTPDGWKKMGEIKINDLVIGSDGKPKKVTGVFPQGKKQLYNVIMTDGGSVSCCEEHLWKVYTRWDKLKGKNGRVITLKQIIDEFDNGGYNRGFKNSQFAIDFVKPIEFKERELPIHPYILGALLGDGYIPDFANIRITSTDNFVIEKIKSHLNKQDEIRTNNNLHFRFIQNRNYSSVYLKDEIKNLGLLGKKSDNKFIPDIYKFASIEQRLEMLRGLMDTDGSVDSKSGSTCSFTSCSELLALGVLEIVRSLGGKASINKRKPRDYVNKYGKQIKVKKHWVVRFSIGNGINPFSLPRKANKFKNIDHKYRSIKKIEKANKEDAVCISIDSEDHLYVVDNHILTHNTALMFYVNTFIAEKYGLPIYWMDSGEMSPEELQLRAAVCLTNGKVPLHAVETGLWNRNSTYKAEMEKVWKRVEKIKFFYEDISSKSPIDIISTVRRFSYNQIGRDNPFLWCLDYLKPFDDTQGESEWRQFGTFVKNIKNFIKNEVPINLQTGIQNNRKGITTGKNSAYVDSGDDAISQDRVTQQVTHALVLRRKTIDEFETEGPDYGNMKIYWGAKTRYLGRDHQRALNYVKNPLNGSYSPNFVNIHNNNFFYEDKGDYNDLAKYLQDQIDLQEAKDENDKNGQMI